MVVLVTRTSHPLLFEAMQVISYNRGDSLERISHKIPQQWSLYLSITEKALASLSHGHKWALIMGEQEDMFEIAQRSPDLMTAHEFLEAFTAGFEEDQWDFER